MFTISLAGVPVGIDNRYPYVRWLCRNYIAEDQTPAFTVRAADQELAAELAEAGEMSPAYAESLCLYRSICMKMPLYGAFLMHAAVVEVDGIAYVFTAPSGTGKSTHVQLWLDHFGPRARVLNGDKPLFRFEENTLYACGTPWQGKENLGCNEMRPVQGICFLEQAPENAIRKLPLGQASRLIFKQVLIPREEEAFNCFWSMLDRMMNTVDFYLLQCNREPEASRLSYLTMRRKQDAENQERIPAAPAGR